MQLIVPKDIEQWLDNTREHRSRAAQIIKLLYDAQEHDTYDPKDDHTNNHIPAAVMGFAVVVSFAYVLVNLVVDLLYLWIDPRIGRGGGE